MSILIKRLPRSCPPRLPYRKAARLALGSKYNIEIIFTTSSAMKKINRAYRGKNKSTNVLAFSLSDSNGQLFLDPAVIEKEAKTLGIGVRRHVWNIYLHGILHLKGFTHSAKMNSTQLQLSRKSGL